MHVIWRFGGDPKPKLSLASSRPKVGINLLQCRGEALVRKSPQKLQNEFVDCKLVLNLKKYTYCISPFAELDRYFLFYEILADVQGEALASQGQCEVSAPNVERSIGCDPKFRMRKAIKRAV